MPIKPRSTLLPPVRTRTRPAPKRDPVDQAAQLQPTNANKRSEPLPPPHPDTRAAEVPTPAAASYEVGYGKPPRHHQFKRGQSGNPRGRPKKAQSLNTIVRKRMLEKVQVKTANGIKRVTRIDALFMKAMDEGGKGELRAIEKLFTLYAAAVPEPREENGTTGPVDPVDLSAADQAILGLFRAEVAADLISAAKSSPGDDLSSREDDDA